MRLGLLTGSLLVALVSSECAVRMLPFHVLHPAIPDYAWMTYDPKLGMANVPGFTAPHPRIGVTPAHGRLAINAQGFRGPPLRAGHPALRIVCLGDSSTFGIWLEHGHAGLPDAEFHLTS